MNDALDHNFRFVSNWVDVSYADTSVAHIPHQYSPLTIGYGFNNVDGDLDTGAVYAVPDNGIAIGGLTHNTHYVVSVVNDTIGWVELADLAPTNPESTESNMEFTPFSSGHKVEKGDGFFPPDLWKGMEFSDPQVVYDADANKFIVTEMLYKHNSTKSKIAIAVSHDADPNDGWEYFYINTQTENPINDKLTAADYPQADISGEYLYITSDQFSKKSYYGSLVSIVSLSSIYQDINEPFKEITDSDLHQFWPKTTFKQTLDVAADIGSAIGDDGSGAFFVGYDGQSEGGNEGNEYVTIAYYDEDTANTTVWKINVNNIDNTSLNPLVATEPEGYALDAGDRRITDAKVIDGHLFAVTEVASGTPENPNVHVHWFEFAIGQDGTPSLYQQGDILGTDILPTGSGVSTLNGSITGDSDYLVLNFTATGPELYPSAYYAVSNDGGVSWTVNQYASSDGPYSDGSDVSRWGDYSSAVVDPTQEHALVISNEYGIDTSSHWGTVIAYLVLA